MKKAWRIASTAIPLLALLILSVGSGRAPDSDSRHRNPPSNESSIARGLRIAPVHLNFQHKNRDLIGMGSYLVNAVGGCNDCHTCPSYADGVEHNPYIGGDGEVNGDNYLAGGLEFQLGPGVSVFSANLTPDAAGLPEGHTFQEFKNLIRTGHDVEENRILQVMPWPVYRNMTDQDLRAIYEYLRAIPSRHTPPPGTCQVPGQATFPP